MCLINPPHCCSYVPSPSVLKIKPHNLSDKNLTSFAEKKLITHPPFGPSCNIQPVHDAGSGVMGRTVLYNKRARDGTAGPAARCLLIEILAQFQLYILSQSSLRLTHRLHVAARLNHIYGPLITRMKTLNMAPKTENKALCIYGQGMVNRDSR